MLDSASLDLDIVLLFSGVLRRGDLFILLFIFQEQIENNNDCYGYPCHRTVVIEIGVRNNIVIQICPIHQNF